MRTIKPEAFPPDQVSMTDDWRTVTELEASQAIRAHMDKTEAIMLERDRQLMELEDQRDAATKAAEARERLLLTAQSEALTNRVAEVLRKFGFDAEDRDEHAAARSPAKGRTCESPTPSSGTPTECAWPR